MGTSVNRPSPSTTSWEFVRKVIGSEAIPTERQSLEVWRAAIRDESGVIVRELSSTTMAAVCALAQETRSPAAAIASFEGLVMAEGRSGLAYDMAKRALVRAAASESGSVGFARELFAEAASYYVSRDLPSFVGAPGRVETASQAIALKESIRAIARDAATAAGEPSSAPDRWRTYVKTVLRKLDRSEKG